METLGQLEAAWSGDPRWRGVTRPYSAKEIVRLRGTIGVEQSLGSLAEDRSTLESLLRYSRAELCAGLRQRLRLELRLISALIAKLRAFSRTTFSFKKAVCERRFFVMHETHPPALAVICCGLLAGAFQAA